MHSAVLASQSLYARSICSLQMCEENQQKNITLHGVDKTLAQRLLSFLYTGVWSDLSHLESKSVLSLGDYLRCDNLVELVVDHIANADLRECAAVLDLWSFACASFADTDTLERVQEACVSFFETNLRRIWIHHRPVLLGLSEGMMLALLTPGNIAADSRVVQDVLWAWAKASLCLLASTST